MTRKECIKEILDNVYGRYPDDMFTRLFNIVSDYQMEGEDNCLDGVLDDYMDETDACEYVKCMLDNDDLCTASKCIRDLHRFTGVYRRDGYGWLDDVDYDEIDGLRDAVLELLGYDPETDDEEDEE